MKPSVGRPELVPELVAVAPGVHAYLQPDGSWMINNTGVVGSDDTLLLVDTTSTEARNRALFASVASVRATDPAYVINTHHHGDHTFGNWLVPPSTVIVGHEACRDEVLAAGLMIASQVLTRTTATSKSARCSSPTPRP